MTRKTNITPARRRTNLSRPCESCRPHPLTPSPRQHAGETEGNGQVTRSTLTWETLLQVCERQSMNRSGQSGEGTKKRGGATDRTMLSWVVCVWGGVTPELRLAPGAWASREGWSPRPQTRWSRRRRRPSARRCGRA